MTPKTETWLKRNIFLSLAIPFTQVLFYLNFIATQARLQKLDWGQTDESKSWTLFNYVGKCKKKYYIDVKGNLAFSI